MSDPLPDSEVRSPKSTLWEKIQDLTLLLFALTLLGTGVFMIAQTAWGVWISPIQSDKALIRDLGVDDVRWMQTFYSGKVEQCGEFAIMINRDLKEVTFFTEEGDWQKGTHWEHFATLPLDGSTTVEDDPSFAEC